MVSSTNAGGGSRPRPHRNRVLLIALLVVVVLIVVLVGGEFYARHVVKSCMSNEFRSEIGTSVDIGLSPKPMLLQLVDKKVPYVTVDSNDSSFGPAKDMKVHARVNDVKIDQTAQSSGTVGSSSADVSWTTDGILSTVQAQSFGGLVSAVESDSSDGTIEFDVGPAGLAKLTVKPVISGSTIDVQTIDAEVLGIGIPTDLVDGLVKTLSDSLQTYPLGMTPQSLKVTDKGIEVTLKGGHYALPAAPKNSDQCGVLT